MSCETMRAYHGKLNARAYVYVVCSAIWPVLKKFVFVWFSRAFALL